MSLALIQESAKEARRLAIAGSPLAVGDFRLMKLIGPLEQAGAKVPVFAQVARAIGELVNGTEAASAANLLALSTILNAILYTQGQSSAEGDYRELETFASKCPSTRTAARVLKPLVQALTTTGAGRLELVKSAVERGAFNDLRLIDPAIYALGDTFPELADLVAEKVLPAFGPGIAPRLNATLDLKGKKQDARKLAVMHGLAPDGTLELCKTALEDGSPEVKATAIACLGKHEECLPLVLEQASSKNKQLRSAALEALAQHDRPEITTLFTQLIKGKALDLLAGPFRALRNRQVLNSLLDQGKNAFALGLKSDEDQILRFAEILECLKGRKDTEVEEFLIDCVNQFDKLSKIRSSKKSALTAQTTVADLADRMAWILYDIGSARALEAVVAKREVLPVDAFNHVLHSALRIWPPDRIYQEFSELLKQDKGPGKLKREILQHAVRTTCRGYVLDPEELYEDSDTAAAPARPQWDPRWLDAAISADEQVLACCLATPGHKAAVNYLLKALEKKGQTDTGLIIRTLARCEFPNVTKQFLDVVAKKTRGARHFDYDLQLVFRSARYLPPADLPRLDEFASRLDEKFVDHFLEAIAPLRSVNPAV